MWSSTDLCNVAQFATVEAKTATRVFLHWVGVVQVHRLGGWRCSSGRRPGEGGGGRGGGSGGSDNRRGAEQGRLSGGSLWLGVLEPPPLVVKQRGLALPLCPSGWHGLKPVDALLEVGMDCLFEMINKAYIAKSRDGSMDFKLSDQFLYCAVTLMQGGELPLVGGLGVWVCKHLIQF